MKPDGGRVTDLINRGGEKISTAEIEAVVEGIPEVAEAAAVPMPDPELGERACLFVRLLPGCRLTIEEITATFTTQGVAAFKIPERLVVLDNLPHTPIGKPDKEALRAQVPTDNQPVPGQDDALAVAGVLDYEFPEAEATSVVSGTLEET